MHGHQFFVYGTYIAIMAGSWAIVATAYFMK
jgi:hypothetical protein